jgi:hypothetical protein
MCPESLLEAFDLALFVAWATWFVAGVVAWHLYRRRDLEQTQRVIAVSRRVERMLSRVVSHALLARQALDEGELDEVEVEVDEDPPASA